MGGLPSSEWRGARSGWGGEEKAGGGDERRKAGGGDEGGASWYVK